ncbi:hypothetical protein K469DRAFT_672849 [Zopfia rhizophila CBS 207.26]|uniref:Uncharacterized protein n=1 Tax=Zopfia rhizophila CBS 207.26 TaxID=1314779 RepID=A0A6A6DN14_9PEZI|nr:hypothetical protein K469DRAFT_672849 [Zopfia rhizophila CBS 207.26]
MSFHLSVTENLLGSLCDLQVFTATAIVVSGLIQLKLQRLTMYHQAFIIEYWNLALYSFWAARQDGAGRFGNWFWSSPEDPFRLWFRRLAVLCSTVLFLAFYGLAIRRMHNEWDIFGSGKCLISHDRSSDDSSWFWLAGLSLYAITLSSSLVAKARGFLLRFSKKVHEEKYELLKRCTDRWKKRRKSVRDSLGLVGRIFAFFIHVFGRILSGLVIWRRCARRRGGVLLRIVGLEFLRFDRSQTKQQAPPAGEGI